MSSAEEVRKRGYEGEIEIESEEGRRGEMESEEGRVGLRREDRRSVCLLTFLYVLQGIPLGLAGSVPLILQTYHVSYSTQATFSFVFWPFSLKIFWAPIVDSIFVARWGRRKSWLIPVQLLLGMTMLLVSANVSSWLGTEVTILPLTASFFLMNFLAATQDIAVDGWALTMLSRQSVGWASTCNTVGQTTGYCIAFILFLALESAEFCNNWLRSVPQVTGLVTFSGFLYFWGIVFLATTLLVAIFKKEGQTPNNNFYKEKDIHLNGNVMKDVNTTEGDLTIIETYMTLWRIIKLHPIRVYLISLLFIKIGFSATDSITGLKLIEKGVSKEKMAFIGTLIVPVQIMLALFVSKYTTGVKPLSTFVIAIFPRMIFGVIFAVLVCYTPSMQSLDGSYPFYYYVILTLIYTSHQFVVYPMFVSMMAFYARISDPSVGGTYMTLLNTASNLCSNVPNTIMLYLVDHLTSKRCHGGSHSGLSCSNKSDYETCTKSLPVGVCNTVIDGYYVEVAICLIIGFVALLSRKKHFLHVQTLPLNAWKVFKG